VLPRVVTHLLCDPPCEVPPWGELNLPPLENFLPGATKGAQRFCGTRVPLVFVFLGNFLGPKEIFGANMPRKGPLFWAQNSPKWGPRKILRKQLWVFFFRKKGGKITPQISPAGKKIPPVWKLSNPGNISNFPRAGGFPTFREGKFGIKFFPGNFDPEWKPMEKWYLNLMTLPREIPLQPQSTFLFPVFPDNSREFFAK